MNIFLFIYYYEVLPIFLTVTGTLMFLFQSLGCHGDSGGPVVIVDSETKVPTQVGTVSWGSRDCAAPGYPGVYGRLLSVRKWIHEKSGI